MHKFNHCFGEHELVRPSNRKHEFVLGSCERKSVQEKLVHKLVEGNRDQ